MQVKVFLEVSRSLPKARQLQPKEPGRCNQNGQQRDNNLTEVELRKNSSCFQDSAATPLEVKDGSESPWALPPQSRLGEKHSVLVTG